MIEFVLPFALVFLSILGFNLGCMVRERIPVLLPWRDPVTMSLFTAAMWPVIVTVLGHPEMRIVDPESQWYIAAMIGFFVCYAIAYIKTEFCTEYIDVHTIRSDAMPNGGDDIRNMVYYRGKDGRLYLQEQSMKEIFKTLIFHVRSPLNFPLGQIQRRRDVIVNKLFLPRITIQVVDVAVETITEEEVKVGPFTFKRRSYKYDPEPSCMANCTSWLANAISLQTAKVELIRKETELIVLRAKNQTETIATGVNLIKGLIEASDISQETIQETINDLAPDEDIEIPSPPSRIIQAQQEVLQPKPERKPKMEKRDRTEEKDG